LEMPRGWDRQPVFVIYPKCGTIVPTKDRRRTMQAKSILQPKYVGWTLFFLSLGVFLAYHLWSFSEYENALFQGLFRR
jgi:hypothetical protein